MTKKKQIQKPKAKTTSEKKEKVVEPVVEVVEVKEEPKTVEGEVVQTQATQPAQTPVKQGSGQKWCCCCAIIFVIFILIWILMQFLSFFMPIFPPLMPGF